ncbi:hypothetical protein bcere0019_11290 [Bacillus cereus Rock3-28]|nr:hypothetical protein bcere0019_11290 [Bacillus cereus Rock3-28]
MLILERETLKISIASGVVKTLSCIHLRLSIGCNIYSVILSLHVEYPRFVLQPNYQTTLLHSVSHNISSLRIFPLVIYGHLTIPFLHTFPLFAFLSIGLDVHKIKSLKLLLHCEHFVFSFFNRTPKLFHFLYYNKFIMILK